jgi:phosphatidylserine decarboxylase
MNKCQENLGLKESLVMALGILPQNLISFVVGFVVRLQFPEFLQKYLNIGFIRFFGLNMAEASKPLPEFKSIEDIFTRDLLPNQRSITGAYVSSADGVVEISRASVDGKDAIQAKGITYSLSQLVFGDENAAIDASWFTTVYLAPHNYHRVHSPFAGKVTGMRHIPGRLWPVNKPAVKSIPSLFCRNERLVFDFDLNSGGRGWVVMVGAFNVGRMETRLIPNFVTNSAQGVMNFSTTPADIKIKEPIPVACGEEIGVFMLGSTTVVVLDKKAVEGLSPKEILTPQKVMMGHSLSR